MGAAAGRSTRKLRNGTDRIQCRVWSAIELKLRLRVHGPENLHHAEVPQRGRSTGDGCRIGRRIDHELFTGANAHLAEIAIVKRACYNPAVARNDAVIHQRY